MKFLLIAVLILNLLIELLASVTLIGGPQGIGAPGLGEQWSMHYGFAALAIASAGLWLWPQRTNLGAVTSVVGILTVFHCGLFVSLFTAGDQAGGMIIHAVMAVLCIIVLILRKRIVQS